jgi:hypothetical protein
MSYTFEAQPKVVQERGKKGKGGDEMMRSEIEDPEKGDGFNIMYDKRVFRGNTHNMNLLKKNLTPQQQEELRNKAERENKKIEMIKNQLVDFKKNKNKQTPYDLRPGPPARIDVDLTYFLTEQDDKRPEENEINTQTDVFLPKPPTPPYIPKKSGIDTETQIWDYDLFDYDQEVQPILNVLVNKTLEQSLLEVEEETELTNIRSYKRDAEKKKVVEREDWEQEVRKEVARIKQKNKVLATAREKRRRQEIALHKLQCLNMAKSYLQNAFVNSLQFLNDNSFWRNEFNDSLNINYKEWLFKSVEDEFNKKAKSEKLCDDMCEEELKKFKGEKDPIEKKREYQEKKKEKMRMIEHPSQRHVHLLFKPPVPPKQSEFSRKVNKYLEKNLEEFEAEEDEKFREYVSK